MDALVSSAVLALIIIVLLPLLGIIMALTPYLMKKSEVFAVTVPESAINDEYLKNLKRRYFIIVVGFTAVLTVFTLALFAAGDITLAVISMAVFSFVIAACSYVLMLYYRNKVNLYKKKQGWEAQNKETVAVVGELEVPQAVSLTWNLLYVPILVVTALVGYLGYDAIPAQIPMQISFEGEITTWMDKSPLVIWIPVLVQVFFAVCFIAAHWAILRSKRPSDPASPLASAFAYGMFAHAQSLYLVIGGLLMAAALIMMPLSFIGVLSLLQAGLIVALAAFVLVIGAIVVSVVYGQGGARVFRRMQESTELLADDDQYWKLGIFYVNPDDPNLFLPARFGIGWTCNFARPLAWVLTASIVVLTLVFVVALFALV